MANLMHTINTFFDMVWFTTTYPGRYIAIALLSGVSAVLFMVVFKKLSNQRAIEKEKKKIAGYLFQIRLYKDTLYLILTSIFGILKHNLFYLRYTFPPIVVIIIPLLIITIQINHRCGYLPFAAGEEFVVYAQIDENIVDLMETIECRASGGIQILTPALRIPDQGGVYWRAKISDVMDDHAGIAIVSKGEALGSKHVVSSAAYPIRFVPEKIKARGMDAFFYNAEGFFAAGTPLETLSVGYHRAQYSFLGIEVDSIVLYFILTMIFALAVKPILKVAI